MKKPAAAQVLLVLAVFLAPIVGGQINTEATMLPPGLDMVIRSLFSGLDGILSYVFPNYQPAAGIETPTLSHALIGLLVVAAAILTLARRQVIQVPFLRVSAPLLAFMAWLVCTLALTSYTSLSMVAISEWFVYGIVFFTVIAAAGRRRGTNWILWALVLGCALVAIKGLFEYGAERHIDPTWRVFSTWANPTSLAGMLSIGLMLALGLAVADEGLTSVLPWTCGLAMACCIMATDSRGGIFSMLAGIVCLCGFVCFWTTKNQAWSGIAKIGSVLVLALVFGRWVHPVAGSSHSAVALSRSPYVLAGQVSPAPPASTLSTPGGQAVEQSSEFRILLWRGAVQLMKENALGYGMGTYRYVSARPGLTTETQLTHNTYLQVGVEAGIIGLMLFLAFLGAWLLEAVRGCYSFIRPMSILRMTGVIVGSFLLLSIVGSLAHVEVFPTNSQKIVGSFGIGLVWLYVEFFRKSPNLVAKQNVLRASMIAAVICMLFDNMLESGLYSFGIGVCVFAILGLGLVQGADGVAPEFIPKVLRGAAGVCAFFVALVLLHAGAVETLRARGRYEMAAANEAGVNTPEGQEAAANANTIATKALSLAPFGIDEADGENWRLMANVAGSYFEYVDDLKQAASWAPNVRNLRALGYGELKEEDYDSAIMNLNKALEEDPNNLLTLSELRDAYVAAGQMDKALQIAQRTVDVENTPYFKIRSLPQLIPVETYQSRAFIAEHTADPASRAALLQASVNGYLLYLQNTVPLIEQMAQTDPNTQYGGETLGLAKVKMTAASNYAKELASAYQSLKRPQDAANAMKLSQQFALALPNPAT